MAEEAKYGVPTAEQLAKINRFAKKSFTAEEVFVFRLKMIGDAMIPGRNMRMDKTLLQEFVKNGENGDVAYMLNHQWFGWTPPKGVMNKGRVFHSWLEDASDVEGETCAQYAEVYIPRDKVKDGVNTNEIIESIEDGSLRDHSVGVGWTFSECSVCGRDVWKDQKCEHYPGVVYDGKPAHIIAKPPGDEFEVSGVFAGAYPTAEVMSGTGGESNIMEEVTDLAALKGMEQTAKVFALFSKDNVRIMVPKGALSKKEASFSIASQSVAEGGEKVEDDKKTVAEAVAAAPVENPPAADLAVAVQNPDDIGIVLERKTVVETLGKEIPAEEILRLAKEGQQYRKELVEDAIGWGIRAQGEGFAVDSWRELLSESARSIEAIKGFREQFQTQTKEALPAGRMTNPQVTAASKKSSDVPNDLFKVG